jgi:hypothetical protein
MSLVVSDLYMVPRGSALKRLLDPGQGPSAMLITIRTRLSILMPMGIQIRSLDSKVLHMLEYQNFLLLFTVVSHCFTFIFIVNDVIIFNVV